MTIHLVPPASNVIRSWYDIGREYASKEKPDYFVAYIAAWVSFNAFCYACYSRIATRYGLTPKAIKDLKRWVNEQPKQGIWTAENDTKNRIILKIKKDKCDNENERVDWFISTVAEKYTEDLVFNEYANEYKEQYKEWIKDPLFAQRLSHMREILTRNNRYREPFIINMRKREEFDPEDYALEKTSQGVVIKLDTHNLSSLKDILYQIRCNLFHGEKTPIDEYDSKVVRSAYPVLNELLIRSCPSKGIQLTS